MYWKIHNSKLKSLSHNSSHLSEKNQNFTWSLEIFWFEVYISQSQELTVSTIVLYIKCSEIIARMNTYDLIDLLNLPMLL